MQFSFNIIPCLGDIKSGMIAIAGARIQTAQGWLMGAGRAKSPCLWFSGKTLTMGFSGELGGSLEWGSIGKSIVHGSVQVERHVSKPCERSTGDTVGWWGLAQCRLPATGQRDATGERSVSLAKMVLYYNTHLAEHAKAGFPLSGNAVRRCN